MKRSLLLLAAGCGVSGTIGTGGPKDQTPAGVISSGKPASKPPRIGVPDPYALFDTEHPRLEGFDRYVPPPEPEEPPLDPDILSHLPKGPAQLAALCARGLENAVTAAFCGSAPPELHGLADLQRLLGVEYANPGAADGQGGNPSFAMSGHSSSLVTRSVSAINPRVILFRLQRNDRADENLLAMGYTRGEQLAEIVVSPPPANGQPQELTFYLLKYTQACNAAGACSFGDLLTPETEQGWAGWTLYQDEDLKNSVVDCLQCHQPQGPGTPKILRMQELQNPWTHWFRNNRDGGSTLLDDYHAAHGTAGYGGIPGAQIDQSDPARLEDFLRDNGFGDQPNEFDTGSIEDEVASASPMQPAINTPPGESSTWRALYEQAVLGNMIPVPYHDVKVTDPVKLAGMTAAYTSVIAQEMPKEDLPDIRDVFLEEALPEMSMRPAAGLDGRGILIHMCGQCHNGRLDQTITRARFDVMRLDAMSRAEKNLAIERLRQPKESRYLMPPRIFRSLSPAEIDLAVTELLK
jgi:hypothetical protein